MLLLCEEFVDNAEEVGWTLLAGVVSNSRDCNDLRLMQDLAQFFLSRSRHNRAAASQYVNDRRFNLADESPELRRDETIADGGIALPDDPAIRARFRSIMHVGAKDLVCGSRIRGFLLSEELVFGRPSLFIFPLQTSSHSVSDFARSFGADIFGNDRRHQFRMESCKDLRDTAAGRIAPDHNVPKAELLGKTLNVLHVIFNKVRAFGIPARIAMPAHIDGQDVVARGEMRRDVIKGVRNPPDAMQHD